MSRFVRKITMVTTSGPQSGTAQTLYRKKNKRKRKVDRWLRPGERLQRRVLEAADAFAGENLRRHNRSNRKRRNGWIRDLPLNQLRATRKGLKKLNKLW